MLYIDLPAGGAHGWGVVGDNLASALARLTPVQRLDDDSLDHPPDDPGPLLQSITRPHLRPRRSPAGYLRHVGYSVFERDIEARRAARDARGTYDVLVAASHWGEQTLREGGLTNVTTIHHGVDTTRFHPDAAHAPRETHKSYQSELASEPHSPHSAHSPQASPQPAQSAQPHPPHPQDATDDFIVFSGGKLELRKGQDIVVRAFRAFASRHQDVRLVAAWHNPWSHLVRSMAGSPYTPFADWAQGTTIDSISRWLHDAGLDPARVTIVLSQPNAALPAIYAASDVGLFPNRCEGSTNLVMMEYMACGRSVIATDFSGHRDVLSNANSRPLRAWRLQPILEQGAPVACWCEPELDEIVEALEAAYEEREWNAQLGKQAAADMAQWTWDRCARQFLDQIEPANALPATGTIVAAAAAEE